MYENNNFGNKKIRTGVSVTYPPLMKCAVARGSTPRFGKNHLGEPGQIEYFFFSILDTISDLRLIFLSSKP
jgi:hypothetical protein